MAVSRLSKRVTQCDKTIQRLMDGYKLQHQLDQRLLERVRLENERDEVAAQLQESHAQLVRHGLLSFLRLILLLGLGQLFWPGKFTFILFLCVGLASEFILIPKPKAPSLWMRWRDVVETRKYLRSLENLIKYNRASSKDNPQLEPYPFTSKRL